MQHILVSINSEIRRLTLNPGILSDEAAKERQRLTMNLEMIEAGWLSLLPPLIAITLALISKEVYSSLFLGILTGMLVYCFSTGGNVLQAVTYVFDMIAAKIGENGYMIIFLVLLGSLVVVVTRSGGSNAHCP